jgi:hypothetical protein
MKLLKSLEDDLDKLAEALRDLRPLSPKDKAAILALGRAYELPGALNPAENALRGVYGGLYDTARVMSAQDIALTSEEQNALEQRVKDYWHENAPKHGITALRIESHGTNEPGKGGLHWVELAPGAGLNAIDILLPSVTPDPMLTNIYMIITLLTGAQPVHPGMFAAQAEYHWRKRLRKISAIRELRNAIVERDIAARLADRHRQDTMHRIDGAAATWNAALDRQGAEGIVPTNWPMRWTKSGPIPVNKPHALPPDAHGPIDNRNGALTPFPRLRLSGKPRRVAIQHKILPPTQPQKLLQRIGRLYRDTWSSFRVDTRTLPVHVDEVGIKEVKDDDREGDDSGNQ